MRTQGSIKEFFINGKATAISGNFHFPPLENGLDYLKSVVTGLVGDPSERELKYAVLHLAAGVEVLLKYRLSCEDWKLLLTKPDDSEVTRAAFERGDFQSIGSVVAFKRLRSTVKIPLSDDDLAVVKTVQAMRNKLQHFGLQESAAAVESITVRALDFILKFLDDYVVPEADQIATPVLSAKMPEIREGTGRIRALVQLRMDKVGPEITKALCSKVRCPRCMQTTLLIEGPPRCAFCGERWDDGCTAAEDYAWELLGLDWHISIKDGGEPPAEECPDCYEPAVVWDSFNTEERIGLCFSCDLQWDDHCTRCGAVMSSHSGEETLCSSCWSEILRRD